MSLEELLQEIRSKGYWRVVVRPTKFEKLRIPSFSEVRKLVQSCTVSLRGWDYPHWNADTVRNMADWVESSEDWDFYKEYWRLYRSGQFIHLFALHEDHMESIENLPSIRSSPQQAETPGGYLLINWTTYTLTEVFEFAARLANKGVLHPSVFISVGLHNVENRRLIPFSEDSGFFFQDYVCQSDVPITIEKLIPQDELVVNPDNLALDFATEIFERFNWDKPSRQILGEYQKRLRERRL